MHTIFDILDILLIPALYVFITFKMVDGKVIRERARREEEVADLHVTIAKQQMKLDTMESFCAKMVGDFRRAGIDSKRVCPQCDREQLESNFDPNDYICKLCRYNEAVDNIHL